MADNLKKPRQGRLMRIGDTLWAHLEGCTYKKALRQPEEAISSDANSASSAGLLTSPMPGTVLIVNVKEGERVKDGDTLVVLEAMKMEYQLAAPFDGKVAKIFKQTGEQTSLGDRLIEVEASC